MQHSETPRKRFSRSASALAAASMLVMSMIGTAQAATTDLSMVLKGTAVGTGTSSFQPGLKGHYDLNVMAQPIPEPASLALMLVGLCGVAGTARMKKRSQQEDEPLVTHSDSAELLPA